MNKLVVIGSANGYSADRTAEIANVLTEAGYQVAYMDQNQYSFNIMVEESVEEE